MEKMDEIPILKQLENMRVFDVGIVDGKLDFYELCDQVFGMSLTKSEARQLVTELTAMIDMMND